MKQNWQKLIDFIEMHDSFTNPSYSYPFLENDHDDIYPTILHFSIPLKIAHHMISHQHISISSSSCLCYMASIFTGYV